ncbi:uncharacterized protein [Epargyreus clarus]|uniref:uncharacterized protein isoform X2 n=1 Tax=Epargyreus clarus TaxID=520877 RepID=UPI003C2D05BC
MSCSRTISIAVGCGKVYIRASKHFLRPLLSYATVTSTKCGERCAHTQVLTKNLEYITNEKDQIKVDPKTMKLTKKRDKPICIMLSWLMARRKHTLKYANLYLEEGFDVVTVSIKPWQLMWPKKGAQMIGWDILRLMAANDTSFMVHGFSVGGYVWSEALVHATKDLNKYQPALDRVTAQVWDSVADITAVTIGVPLALFPDRPVLQKMVKGFLEFYLFVFRYIATKHYKLASETYYATPCRAPCLFLLSSTDPVGAERNIRNACEGWRKMGIKCTWQCWDRSAHLNHYLKHPAEYVRLVKKHIRDNLPQAEQREADTVQRRATA